MFLVPSVMKLLGDDCWWAPRWARRLQSRIGLGEIHLPDERKRPVTAGRTVRPPVTAGLVAANAAPRPPHDPTHPAAPGALEAPRLVRTAPGGARPETTPSPNGPATGTKQVPVRSSSTEAPTTRLTAPGGQVGQGGPGPAAPSKAPTRPPTPVPASAPTPPSPPRIPSEGQTRALPVPGGRADDVPAEPGDKTAAMPVQRPEGDDSDAATQQLNARGQEENGSDQSRQRRRGGGGGLSAQDLLRREGRL
ncbi:hypothetical protein A9W95_00480 [Mycobacterium sp. 1423905.2]|nr:hypothetical protein A9W95_00480 [Mycobacterium sp. 1423905.2]